MSPYVEFKTLIACTFLSLGFSLDVLANNPAKFHRAVDKGVQFSDQSSSLIGFERFPKAGVSDGVAGVAWLDYDADGDLDLFLSNTEGHQNGLFENTGNGEFKDVTLDSGLADYNGYSGVAAGDIDNDGYPDLYLTGNGGMLSFSSPNRLYHNNGDGTFSDISHMSGTPGSASDSSVAMADFNNDGLLDIFVAGVNHMYYFYPPGYTTRNSLYINNGDLSFSDITTSSGVDSDLAACAAVATDHNNDGWMDILVANCFSDNVMPLQLYQNNKDGTFTDIAADVGLNVPGFWTGLSLGDYDNDGDLDIFATTFGINPFTGQTYPAVLFRKDRNGGYSDVTPLAVRADEYSRGSAFADWDNDGYIDLFYAGNWFLGGAFTFGNPGRLFFNDGAGSFTEDSQALSINLMASQTAGVAHADYDNDGFVDIAISAEGYNLFNPETGEVVMSGPGKPHLLRNEGNRNNWVNIRLRGTKSNSMGVGAKLTLITLDGSGFHRQVREVAAGGSYLSSATPWPTFGMGNSRRGFLSVEWPSGKNEIFLIRANRAHVVEEGQGFRSTGKFFSKDL